MAKLTKKEAVRLHREMWKIISEMTDEEFKKCEKTRTEINILALKKMGFTKDNSPFCNCFCCEYAASNVVSGQYICDLCPIKWKEECCVQCSVLYTDIHASNYEKARETAKMISELPEREDESEYYTKTPDYAILNKDKNIIHRDSCKTEENKKFKVGVATIIGSLSQSAGPIRDAAKLFSDLGFDIYDPIINNNANKDDTLYDIQCKYIRYIEEADFVVLVRKPDGSIGESTSYELAFSTFLEKPILEWGTFFNG